MNEFKQDIEKAERTIFFLRVCGALSAVAYIVVELYF